ncbi:DUF2065 domain-containing protein [Marinobacterium arenosum]|uniref:DUF2065 domain-containing protein n=1 Tax=Marinobacterium arenosum TaxID=2862496 RepID=UPI001C95F9B2|nr:DUF2065 domain-containing protein [Marinobacterium arenosum]MBY4677061.1 DUF2065 domain-containing protein [Marinobacterium arenosum]
MSEQFWQALAAGFALMLIIEGVIPFLYPQRWRQLVQQLALVSNRVLRWLGFVSMCLGVLLLYWIR